MTPRAPRTPASITAPQDVQRNHGTLLPPVGGMVGRRYLDPGDRLSGCAAVPGDQNNQQTRAVTAAMLDGCTGSFG
jgi:hypothetical protein